MTFRTTRTNRGSVLPFVAIAMTVVVAYVGFSVDVTRTIVAVRKIEFAADAAARYAYSFATNGDGSYTTQSAQQNIVAALADPSGSSSGVVWNNAPAGPANGDATSSAPWNTGVTFQASDAVFVANPADQSEQLLQLTSNRQGTDTLYNIFMPALYSFTGGGATAPNRSLNPIRTVEVVGQPASRIGAGAPTSVARNGRSLAGCGVFPLALSNAQFQAAASPTNTTTTYVVDLVTSLNAGSAATSGHIKGCFVNDAPSGNSSPYYGPSQGSPAIDQLINLIGYFKTQPSANAVPPAAVERGAKLGAFDPADATFANRQSNISTALSQLTPGQILILPVLNQDPQFGGNLNNQVAGFARMQLVQAVSTTGSLAIVLKIVESVPVRDAVCEGGLATIPQFDGTTMMPAPVAPFVLRQYQPADNSIAVRPRGVALAPCTSPRILPAS